MPKEVKKPRITKTPEEVRKTKQISIDTWTTPQQASKLSNLKSAQQDSLEISNSFEALVTIESEEDGRSMAELGKLVKQVAEIAKKQISLETKVSENFQQTQTSLKKVERRVENIDREVRRKQANIWGYPAGEFPLNPSMPPERKREVIRNFFLEVLKVPDDKLREDDIDDVWISDPYNDSKSNSPAYRVKVSFLRAGGKSLVAKYLRNFRKFNEGRLVRVHWGDNRTQIQDEKEKEKREGKKKKGQKGRGGESMDQG